jgi:hypothetical protein
MKCETIHVASSAGLTMGSSLRIGFSSSEMPAEEATIHAMFIQMEDMIMNV